MGKKVDMRPLLVMIMLMLATNTMAANETFVTVHVSGTVYRYENGGWSVMYGVMSIVPDKVAIVTTDQSILLNTCRGDVLVPAYSVVTFVPAVGGLYNSYVYGRGTATYDMYTGDLRNSRLFQY